MKQNWLDFSKSLQTHSLQGLWKLVKVHKKQFPNFRKQDLKNIVSHLCIKTHKKKKEKHLFQ